MKNYKIAKNFILKNKNPLSVEINNLKETIISAIKIFQIK